MQQWPFASIVLFSLTVAVFNPAVAQVDNFDVMVWGANTCDSAALTKWRKEIDKIANSASTLRSLTRADLIANLSADCGYSTHNQKTDPKIAWRWLSLAASGYSIVLSRPDLLTDDQYELQSRDFYAMMRSLAYGDNVPANVRQRARDQLRKLRP